MFGYGQNHVRRRDVLVHSAGDFVANHLRQDHGDWLPKHDSLSLNPAHAPPKNPQTIDHCGMRIRPNHRVWGDQVWSHTQKSNEKSKWQKRMNKNENEVGNDGATQWLLIDFHLMPTQFWS